MQLQRSLRCFASMRHLLLCVVRRFHLSRARRILLRGVLVACPVVQGVQAARVPSTREDFSSRVQLAPFVVNGHSLAISIYARSQSDRRYGEQFTEGVARTVYEAVTESTGKGLVIVGAKGEPHPIMIFRQFVALAKNGKLDPEVAGRSVELSLMMERWADTVYDHRSASHQRTENADVGFEFDQIITALPLPLVGLGSKLYQIAWAQNFDEAKIEAKLSGLRSSDLEQRDLFGSFDWAFYLPPKGALDRVIDAIIAQAISAENISFFERVAAKSAMSVVRPKIRRAIESMRQSMLFMTVVEARTRLTKTDVSALTAAYLRALLSEGSTETLSESERAAHAVREQLRLNREETHAAQSRLSKQSETNGGQSRAHFLFIGSYHMNNPKRDVQNIDANDVMSGKRQREILEVARLIGRYRPTKIVVEANIKKQEAITKAYAAYCEGARPLARSEHEQLGFRIARDAGIAEVYAVDWNDLGPIKDADSIDYLRAIDRNGQQSRYEAFLSAGKEQNEKSQHVLREGSVLDMLRHLNSREWRKNNARAYFEIGLFGTATDPAGANWIQYWYGRNLAIFNNIVRNTKAADRVLVIYGAGHGNHLCQLAEDSGIFVVHDPLRWLSENHTGQ